MDPFRPLKFLKKSSGQLIVVGAFRLKFGMVGNTRSPESVFGVSSVEDSVCFWKTRSEPSTPPIKITKPIVIDSVGISPRHIRA